MLTTEKLKTNSQAGFSLIELMGAIVIFLVVTGAIYGLLRVGQVDRNRSSRRADILKNARVGVHMLGRDALNAGLSFNTNGAVVPDNFLSVRFGLNAPDPNTNRDILSAVFAGDNVFANNLLKTPGAKTDVITFAFRDLEFNGGDTIALKNVMAGAQPSTVRLESVGANDVTAANVQPYDLYLVESDTSQVAIMATGKGPGYVDAAVGDPIGLNQPFNVSGEAGSMLKKCPAVAETDPPPTNCTTYNATLKRFYLVSYRVKEDGTLVRISYGNNRGAGAGDQIVERPIAYDVEDLQLKYVLSNGKVLDNPGAGPDMVYGTADDTPEEYNYIRQIMVSLKVQAPEDDEQMNKRVTVTLNATFSTRNMGYDAG